MRKLIAAHALCALTLLASACGASGDAQTANTNSTPARNSNANADSKTSAPPSVASSHGSSNDAAANSSDANLNKNSNTNAQAAERALVDTKAIDEKIEKALKKAKASGASASDRAAAAEAYLERANVYFSGGNPRLYKYALADFNSVLLYEPANSEAKLKRDEIVRIYKDMGRPVPQVSNEQ
jgi:hypothetical protein